MRRKAFISYAREGSDHQKWVEDLAERLRSDGIDVVLDVWEMHPGDQLPAFMERSVRDCEFVVIVCTPAYKLRSDGRAGGVGYESTVITGELLAGASPRKFIPLLRSGIWKEAGPSPLLGSYYIDVLNDPANLAGYGMLRDTLLRRLPKAPPLGRPPPASSPAATSTAKRRRGASSGKRSSSARPLSTKRTGASSAASAEEFLRVVKDVVSRRLPLSECLAEALRLSIAGGHTELRAFCERELRGISGGTLDKRSPDFPHHRVFEMYVGYATAINPQFFGWNQSASNVFAYLDAHPSEFTRMQTVAPQPVSQLEAAAAQVARKKNDGLKAWQKRAGDFDPETPHPDIPVFCYARRDIDERILEATRGELTRLLMDLLPAPSTAGDQQTKTELLALYARKYGMPITAVPNTSEVTATPNAISGSHPGMTPLFSDWMNDLRGVRKVAIAVEDSEGRRVYLGTTSPNGLHDSYVDIEVLWGAYQSVVKIPRTSILMWEKDFEADRLHGNLVASGYLDGAEVLLRQRRRRQ
jgi:hypothetical protein